MSKINIGPLSVTVPSMGPSFYAVDKKEAQKTLANVEIGMNWAGYIVPYLPFINNWAADVRFMAGSAEAAIGLVWAGVRLVQAQLEKKPEEYEKAMQRVWEPLEYVEHGVGNIGRSFLERVRIVNLLVAIFWDYRGERQKYQAEKELDLQKAKDALDNPNPLRDWGISFA